MIIIVKPLQVQLEELQKLCGSIDIVRSAITTEEVVQLVHQTLDKFGVPTTYAQSVAFVITNGPNPAYFVSVRYTFGTPHAWGLHSLFL